ncbi:uncharacterized protein LOC106660173 [Trichogramma pretiosum]|uniref:uncharacterized protein LOC106660173 n=1 Tax=Trichogramma pretiosum TaxID=7493 RepID=UPI000C71974E|nr:uncharacterized protein LOC106660173 [Trichogramma pretiosum]
MRRSACCCICSLFVAVLIVFGTFYAYSLIDSAIAGHKDCECINYDCGCCAHVHVSDILDGNLCSNFTYLPDPDYGISTTITYNNLTIFNKTVSARNPPPICVIHVEKIEMEFCLRFEDLEIKDKCFTGHTEVEIEFFHVVPLKHIDLGHFAINCPKPLAWYTKLWNLVNVPI